MPARKCAPQPPPLPPPEGAGRSGRRGTCGEIRKGCGAHTSSRKHKHLAPRTRARAHTHSARTHADTSRRKKSSTASVCVARPALSPCLSRLVHTHTSARAKCMHTRARPHKHEKTFTHARAHAHSTGCRASRCVQAGGLISLSLSLTLSTRAPLLARFLLSRPLNFLPFSFSISPPSPSFF